MSTTQEHAKNKIQQCKTTESKKREQQPYQCVLDTEARVLANAIKKSKQSCTAQRLLLANKTHQRVRAASSNNSAAITTKNVSGVLMSQNINKQ